MVLLNEFAGSSIHLTQDNEQQNHEVKERKEKKKINVALKFST